MSERRRGSLSKITEGTQALLGMVDGALELKLEKPRLARDRSQEGRVIKPSPRSGAARPGGAGA